MQYIAFTDESGAKPLCILTTDLNRTAIKKAYIDPFSFDPDDVIALGLFAAPGKKKTPIKEIMQYIQDELIPVLKDFDVHYIICTNADYFKALSRLKKAESYLGYVVPSIVEGIFICYAPTYRSLFLSPTDNLKKLNRSVNAMIDHANGVYVEPGKGIIRRGWYPQTNQEIADALEYLLTLDCPLSCDVEAFDLKAHKAGVGTIAFAWNKHEGVSFCVDYRPTPDATAAPYGEYVVNPEVRKLLVNFFLRSKHTIRYHNIGYDACVLIYQLLMKDITDTEGMLHGLELLMTRWDDTKLITYLATNSCSKVSMSLKDQAQEFAGNYSVDEAIKDIRNIPKDKLLEYNLVDALSTHYVYEKNYPSVLNDEQEEIYETLFKPAMRDIMQMQLTGLPINLERVKEVADEIQADFNKNYDIIQNSSPVQEFVHTLNEQWVAKKNATLKVKRVTLADAKETFNPNSDVQLQGLLFGQLELPVISLTDNGQPSTDGASLKALTKQTTDPAILDLLQALRNLKLASTILTNFIPAMLNAIPGADGWHYLAGNYNLGGTVSGRLSSSDPNMQNIPANTHYGKLIKSAFSAPPGWLLVGLDFASLEDRISALTTKDPNKLKVYIDGYDGHCLRAFSYFGDQMQGIDPNCVQSINTIETKYKALRQESKAPTFALTYQGTYRTLMKNCGFSESKARMVEAKYQELYKVSIAWVQSKLDKASKDGYITGAFGLRIRTPLLPQVVRGTSKTPNEAEAEGRTAGNALGQSWCLLNSRAWAATMAIVRESQYRADIRLCAQIHDAGYVIIRDNVDALMFMNEHIVREVNWNHHPDIFHDIVGLGGELSIFYPNWSKEIIIPNGATEEEILDIVKTKS